MQHCLFSVVENECLYTAGYQLLERVNPTLQRFWLSVAGKPLRPGVTAAQLGVAGQSLVTLEVHSLGLLGGTQVSVCECLRVAERSGARG